MLGQVACELANALPREHGRTNIVPSIETPLHVERLDELALRLATLVARELGPEAHAVTPPTFWRDGPRPGKTQPSESSSPGRVIVVRARFEHNRFSARADDVASVPRFWERWRPVAPGSRAHAESSRPLDAELRSFVAPAPLVVSGIEKSPALEEESVAVACGDADGDGANEIISIGRQRVQLWRLVQGRFVALKTLLWSRLSDIAPSPLREPIGSAVVRAPGALEIGSTDRAEALRFDAGLNVVARFPDRLPWPGAGCASIDAFALRYAPVPCDGAAPNRATSPEHPGIDAVAGLRVVRSEHAIESLLARRRQADGLIELLVRREPSQAERTNTAELGGTPTVLDEPAGAQLALGDLNGDGRAELVTTADTRDPTLDFVRVRSLGEDAALSEAFRVPVPSGVHALAVCPLDAAGLTPIVVATGEGLWVIH